MNSENAVATADSVATIQTTPSRHQLLRRRAKYTDAAMQGLRYQVQQAYLSAGGVSEPWCDWTDDDYDRMHDEIDSITAAIEMQIQGAIRKAQDLGKQNSKLVDGMRGLREAFAEQGIQLEID